MLVIGMTGCDSNLVSFDSSACKSDMGDANAEATTMGLSRQALSSEQYDGLNCVLWQVVSSNRIKIDLTNFAEGCGVTWEGESSSDDPNSVELRVNDSDCESEAACGWCIYDWSFEVDELSTDEDLTVKMIIDDNCGGDGKKERVHLPLSATSSGAICRYADNYALSQHARETDTCGKLHMPCLGEGECDSRGDPGQASSATATDFSCEDELVCASSDPYDNEVCYQPCESDADCPLPDIQSCQDNLCRLTETW